MKAVYGKNAGSGFGGTSRLLNVVGRENAGSGLGGYVEYVAIMLFFLWRYLIIIGLCIRQCSR